MPDSRSQAGRNKRAGDTTKAIRFGVSDYQSDAEGDWLDTFIDGE